MRRGWVVFLFACLHCGAPSNGGDANALPNDVLQAERVVDPDVLSAPDAAVAPDASGLQDAALDAPSASLDATARTDAAADTQTPAPDVVALDARPDSAASMFTLPPVNAPLDYQLGGPYTPPTGVRIVSRDRTAPIAPGLYNICYVNGFQVQPDELTQWRSNNPDLLLRDASGMPVIDTDWNEQLIDVSTASKRMRVAAIVDGWIAGCRTAGYNAVEIDNLDSFTRSRGLLQENDAVATMALFAASAHARGMAVAQKNSAELVPRRREMNTDFVVAEECNRFSECDVYTASYGEHVLVIEYRRADFTAGCTAFPNLSIVLRDRNLVVPGASGYVYAGC